MGGRHGLLLFCSHINAAIPANGRDAQRMLPPWAGRALWARQRMARCPPGARAPLARNWRAQHTPR
eukprot:422104-Lingulodinium_polyedra.AAC.1